MYRPCPFASHPSTILRLVVFLLLLAPPASAQTIRGRWVGQDGHDFVGPNPALAPSGVQDMHFRVEGLPPNDAIASASIRGLGGDEWLYEGRYGPWKAHLVRQPHSPVADFFVEPSHPETGRPFTIQLHLESGRSIDVNVPGGRANPSLRMPSARLSARWVGQEERDLCGDGPSVGPDGRVDADIALEQLTKGLAVKTLEIRASNGSLWAFGTNPSAHPNAEFQPDPQDPSKGHLLFQPTGDLKGQTLRITVLYSNDTTDSTDLTAGPTDPRKIVPPPEPPNLSPLPLQTRWLGQDDSDGPHRGWVRVEISGLPDPSDPLAAALSDPVGASWIYRSPTAPPFDVAFYPRPLELIHESAKVILTFPPVRDETGSTLTARFLLADGRQVFADVPGGPASPEKRAPQPASTQTDAHPGDDLQSLVNQFGTVRLAPGLYQLNRPLILSKPCNLEGQADGVTLQFHQPETADPWTAAIKIHAGTCTLDRFSVRLVGPTRWAEGINYGPAIIGTSDNLDKNVNTSRIGIHLRRLDLESPPPSKPWEESVRLARLMTAESGSVEFCRLRGGIVEFSGGPWTITDNTSLGVPPNAVSPCVFAGHNTHDLLLARNRTSSQGPSGKTWRFLVLTNQGAFDRVEDNVIDDIGPRDNDVIPSMNAPEIILTESYRLRFEGRPLGLFQNGRVLVIPDPQGDPADPGDVVSVLEGDSAGQFVRVAQRIDSKTYLLAQPLQDANAAVSITPAFWSETFERNRIDALGGSVANGFVLAGNHFKTLVKDNTVLGCGEAFRLLATPSEFPGPWGWSHAPFLGVTVEGNTVQDNLGFSIAVEHGPPVKTTRGRVYQTVNLRNNTVIYTREPASGVHGLTLGNAGTLDPSELVVTASGNVAEGSKSASVLVHGARVNGHEIKDRVLSLPSASKPR